MIKQSLLLLFLFLGQISFSQGFKTLYIEKKNVDSNNDIFKIGKAFVYDYEIIINDTAYMMNHMEGLPNNKFELTLKNEDAFASKIFLIIPRIKKTKKTNKNQTEIYYLYTPGLSFMTATGIVENKKNIWIHPPRSGIFQSLETCPFPYIQLPIEIGKEWKDKMKIGDHWCNELWGIWDKKLLLNYNYRISEATRIKTSIGELECYVVESTAKSDIGMSKLKSYFSEKYGFVRLEYELTTGIKINVWLDSISNNDFNDQKGIIKYIEELKNCWQHRI